MTDATNPGDVVITGQRRQSPLQSFPVGGGNKGNDQGPVQNTDAPDDGTTGGGADPAQPDPCATPLAKLIWNADATGAASVNAFIAKSHAIGDGGSIANREFAANLMKDANGGVSIDEVAAGNVVQPGVVSNITIPVGNTTYLNWMGDVHTHPSGVGIPSATDWTNFQNRVADILSLHPERNDEMTYAAMYIVVGTPPNHKVYAYTRFSTPNQLGVEVNPGALPCPN